MNIDDTPLDEVLEEITLSFQAQVAALKPDISFLEGKPGVVVKGDIIVFDDDVVIDTKTLDGIMTIELLRAQMSEQNIPEIMDDIYGVLGNYQNSLDRGLYRRSTRL